MRFLLIDRILSVDPGREITGIKNATMSEDFFTHHFPQVPVMPGMLMLEGMIQLGRWLVIHDSSFVTSGVVSSVREVKYRGWVLPGDQIEMRVECLERDGERAVFRGVAKVDGRARVTSDFTLREMPLKELEDPVEAQRHYQVLIREETEGRA